MLGKLAHAAESAYNKPAPLAVGGPVPANSVWFGADGPELLYPRRCPVNFADQSSRRLKITINRQLLQFSMNDRITVNSIEYEIKSISLWEDKSELELYPVLQYNGPAAFWQVYNTTS